MVVITTQQAEQLLQMGIGEDLVNSIQRQLQTDNRESLIEDIAEIIKLREEGPNVYDDSSVVQMIKNLLYAETPSASPLAQPLRCGECHDPITPDLTIVGLAQRSVYCPKCLDQRENLEFRFFHHCGGTATIKVSQIKRFLAKLNKLMCRTCEKPLSDRTAPEAPPPPVARPWPPGWLQEAVHDDDEIPF